MSDDKYEIMREIEKGKTEKAALEEENEKAKNDFAKELIGESPVMYDIPYAFTRKKPFKVRFKEKREHVINKIKAVLGIYDKQEF